MHRSSIFRAMGNENFDLLVIGGGITGAGIALDGQTRGLETALLEMQDFASGTSSRSTKLVHGGLRYLKQGEVRMVWEVGRERAIVYENGPHVTSPVWMLLPIYEGGSLGLHPTSLGLWLYDRLAGVKGSERRKMLSRAETLARIPFLKQEGLKGSGLYVEYRTDDARLTIEVVKAAAAHGARVLNYVKAIGLHYDQQGRIMGVEAEDQLTGERRMLRAKRVVNAAGPWVDQVRAWDDSPQHKRLFVTKGVHLVFNHSRLPLTDALYFDTEDGRMVFAIPRHGKTYVGTTDTPYDGDYANPRMTQADLEYLLRTLAFIFPERRLGPEDVESSWAGLRPLIYEEGKDPTAISRKDEMWITASGLISIAGGKLTGYRRMAEQVVDEVVRQLEVEGVGRFKPCQTRRLALAGGEVGGARHFPRFIQEQVAEGIRLGLPKEVAERFVQRYGSNIHRLYQLYRELNTAEDEHLLPWEWLLPLQYGMEYELVAKPSDFFIRRTGALFFQIELVKHWYPHVLTHMARALGWSEAEYKEYEGELLLELAAASAHQPNSVAVN